MTHKLVHFRSDAREKILRGATAIADAIEAEMKSRKEAFDDAISSAKAAVAEGIVPGRGNYGFDAARGKYVDLTEAGIIDPTKVVRIAFENAVLVASVLLLTEATLTEVPAPKTEHASMGSGRDGSRLLAGSVSLALRI